MSSPTRILFAAAAVSAAALTLACSKPEPAAKLGVAVPLSGDLESAGRGIERAARIALEEAQSRGDLPGPVELMPLDDRAEPAAAAEAAAKLVADPQVFAVIGHLTSGCSLEAAKIYAGAGLAMLTPSATAPEVTSQQTRDDWSGPRVVFRLPPSDSLQGSYAAEFALTRLSLKSVFILRDGTPYGDGLAREFRRRFEERGGKVLGEAPIARGQRDFSEIVARAEQAKPDLLFFGGVFTEAALILKQLRATDSKLAFLSGDGSKNDDLFRLAGAASDGAFFTVGGVPVENLPSAADFVERYKARYGGAAPRTFDHYAYVATRLALAAFKKAGAADRAKVLEALRRTEAQTMLGDISFDSKGDTNKSFISMTKAVYQEKRFELVY